MGTSIRNKIGAGDLGDATKVREYPEGSKDALYLGSIVGMVQGLTYRANPNGDEPSVGFKGVFEGTPADPDADCIQAPTLFLPGSVSRIFEETVLAGKPRPVDVAPKRGAHVDVPTDQLPVLLEISAKKSGNALGYEYIINIHGEQKKVDVIEGLKAMLPSRLGGAGHKTLTLPKAEMPELPQPAKAAASATKAAKKKSSRK